LRIEVHRTGDTFVAYDPQGKRITDRNILEQISFDQMPGFKVSYYVDIKVDTTAKPAIINDIIINTQTRR
jgi:hypothetical protein